MASISNPLKRKRVTSPPSTQYARRRHDSVHENPLPKDPYLRSAMQAYPEYSKGYTQWLLLPLAVRRRIYYYHFLHYTGRTPPLIQTCKTFRREMFAGAAERHAVFNSCESLKTFVEKWQQRFALSYITTFSIDLTPPNSHLTCTSDIHALLNLAYQHLRLVTHMTFLIPARFLAGDGDFSTLEFRGPFTRFQHLEKVTIKDLAMDKVLGETNGLDEHALAEKVSEWHTLYGEAKAQRMRSTVQVVRKANEDMDRGLHAWRKRKAEAAAHNPCSTN